MDHQITYFEKVKAFAIEQKKEQETRRFVLESNLGRKGYKIDAQYYKTEISKCHANEEYLNFIIFILEQREKEIIKLNIKKDSLNQVTFSLNNNG